MAQECFLTLLRHSFALVSLLPPLQQHHLSLTMKSQRSARMKSTARRVTRTISRHMMIYTTKRKCSPITIASYHMAIMGNKELFKDKVVMDVGTGSGILAVWAAKAGAKRVYAVEYTSMADHAKSVVKANRVDHIVKVIQGAVEDVQLPLRDEDWSLFCDDDAQECVGNQQVVDIIVSEWMGYFLLRESMLDSVIYARDKFLKPTTGLLFPSHATMLLAPIGTEPNYFEITKDYNDAMDSWHEYLDRAKKEYNVDMSCLESNFEEEQWKYYLLSGHWLQLGNDAVLAKPAVVKTLDMATSTLEDAKGVDPTPFEFDLSGGRMGNSLEENHINAFAGWFTVDFKSRTDEVGKTHAPKVQTPTHLSTGPEIGVTHWGQQVFYLPSNFPLIQGKDNKVNGRMELVRKKESARLYNFILRFIETTPNPVELAYEIV
ncbi:hypothetical protein ACHAWF_006602 [Thalassiosira exigua]